MVGSILCSRGGAMNKLILLAPLLILVMSGLAGASGPTVPSGLSYYVPINLTNSQSTATPNPFQQMINLSESNAIYGSYIAYSGSTANFEYFYGNGTIIPAWIESNSSGSQHSSQPSELRNAPSLSSAQLIQHNSQPNAAIPE